MNTPPIFRDRRTGLYQHANTRETFNLQGERDRRASAAKYHALPQNALDAILRASVVAAERDSLRSTLNTLNAG